MADQSINRNNIPSIDNLPPTAAKEKFPCTYCPASFYPLLLRDLHVLVHHSTEWFQRAISTGATFDLNRRDMLRLAYGEFKSVSTNIEAEMAKAERQPFYSNLGSSSSERRESAPSIEKDQNTTTIIKIEEKLVVETPPPIIVAEKNVAKRSGRSMEKVIKKEPIDDDGTKEIQRPKRGSDEIGDRPTNGGTWSGRGWSRERDRDRSRSRDRRRRLRNRSPPCRRSSDRRSWSRRSRSLDRRSRSPSRPRNRSPSRSRDRSRSRSWRRQNRNRRTRSRSRSRRPVRSRSRSRDRSSRGRSRGDRALPYPRRSPSPMKNRQQQSWIRGYSPRPVRSPDRRRSPSFSTRPDHRRRSPTVSSYNNESPSNGPQPAIMRDWHSPRNMTTFVAKSVNESRRNRIATVGKPYFLERPSIEERRQHNRDPHPRPPYGNRGVGAANIDHHGQSSTTSTEVHAFRCFQKRNFDNNNVAFANRRKRDENEAGSSAMMKKEDAAADANNANNKIGSVWVLQPCNTVDLLRNLTFKAAKSIRQKGGEILGGEPARPNEQPRFTWFLPPGGNGKRYRDKNDERLFSDNADAYRDKSYAQRVRQGQTYDSRLKNVQAESDVLCQTKNCLHLLLFKSPAGDRSLSLQDPPFNHKDTRAHHLLNK